MKIQDSMKKGTAEMILLRLLKEEDLYCYQMSLLIKERSHGIISFPEGSLYPALYKLEGSGYITSYEKKVGKRLRRIYYHIEDSGREYLSYLIREYSDITQGITLLLNQSPSKADEPALCPADMEEEQQGLGTPREEPANA